MPPKKQQKKQIVKVFEKKPFWKYATPNAETNDKINTFLVTFDKQLKQLFNLDLTLQQNYEILCQKIGYPVHPCLQIKKKEQSHFPDLKNNDYGENYVQIMNHKIDAPTLKLLGFLLTVYKINSLKFCRNDLDLEAQEIKKILEKDDSISTLFFQWNPLPQSPLKQQIFLLTVRPRIQHLILRDNHFGDQIFKDIIQKVKSMPELCLKSLDVAGNNITKASSQIICKFIEEQKNLQYLSLAKNQIHGKKFMSKLFNSIGQVPIKQQEWLAHQEAIKARDEVIERNKKKKKGAVDEPVPIVLDVKQTEEGRFYIKNTSLQIISLAKNGLGDTCAALIKNFSENQGKNIKLFLDGNKFTKKEKQNLKMIENLLM